jgi:release factor glutamine methyltransferase
VIELSGSEGMTAGAALRVLSAAFAEAGIDNPALDARLLLSAATGLKREDLIARPDRALEPDALTRLRPLAARRLDREPVSRILRRREFWGLPLRLTPDVLDPRPETETLVEAALAAFAPRRRDTLRVLDLGAGSGAILCALLSEWPNAFGVGVDVSSEAATVAKDNLAALGLAARSSVVVGHWDDSLTGRFDVVVSNPPYIASAEIDALEPEVRRHDPRRALDGGLEGLDAYRALAVSLGRIIAPRGAFFLEIGAAQGEPVLSLLAGAGLGDLALVRDLAGHDRVAQGRSLAAAHQQGPWREAKKRLVLSSESSSAQSPSESRAAAGIAGACRAPAPTARD